MSTVVTYKGAAAGGEKYQTSHALRAEPPRFPDDLMKEWKSNQKCFFFLFISMLFLFLKYFLFLQWWELKPGVLSMLSKFSTTESSTPAVPKLPRFGLVIGRTQQSFFYQLRCQLLKGNIEQNVSCWPFCKQHWEKIYFCSHFEHFN